jgi:DNA polymerase-1
MPLPSDLSLTLVNTIDDAMAMKRWLGERREVLGLDTETSGLDPHAPDAKLRLVQIGDHKSGWAVPWEQWGGAVMECLEAWEGPITLHNAAFDARWLSIHAGWKPPWHRIHDTMIMAQIDNPLGSGALKQLAVKHVDRRAAAGEHLLKEAMSKEGWTWGNIPVDYDAYWAYGALDPVITAHLWTHFRTDLKYSRVYDLEMAARRVVSKMEDNGARVDLEYCERKLKELTEYVDRSKAWAKEAWGISIGSSPQVAKFFKDTLNQEVERTTNSGAPSADKAQMMIFSASDDARVAQAAKFILQVRKADKLAGTYFSNFLSMNNDGILHPSIKTLGARTGRMSMTNPALQTLPKGEATVRDAFIPTHEGDVLVSSDYSQIEMRLMAHFSGDPNLQKAFRDADATGGDFFVGLGKDIYQDPEFNKKDKRRGLVKNTLYGKAYGAGVNKMSETAGVPYEVMKGVVDAVDTAYPGLKMFQKEVEHVGMKREREEGQGYVMTPFGRRLPCDDGKVYALTNYMLQGHAAEILKDALVRMDAAGLGDYMLLPVHDEVIFSLPEKDLKEAMDVIGTSMSVMEGYAVPMPADPEGPLYRWGDKYRGDEQPARTEELLS